MLIPWQQLDPDTLRNLLEEYVSREGTDYGMHEYTLEQKVSHIERQMQRGELVLVWDHETETCNLLLRERMQSSADPESPGNRHE